MSKVQQGLTRARILLNEPHKWTQQQEVGYFLGGMRFCLWGAIKRTAADQAALDDAAVAVASTIDPFDWHKKDYCWTIINWNDAPGRTYKDVTKLLDKALETISKHSERMPT